MCSLAPMDVGIFIPTAIGDKKYHKQLDRVTDTMDLREAFDTKRVVFSTYTAARDGNNRKALDALVMAVPTGNVEQAAGRVLRTLDGKKQPIVVDLIDTEGPMIRSYLDPSVKVNWFLKGAQKRKEFYEKMEWEVQENWLK